jgi:virginiamycin B lyase
LNIRSLRSFIPIALLAICANLILVPASAASITEFPIPQGNGLFGITTGSDGNLWFADYNKIGRITPSGTITEFIIPTSDASASGITAGPDGNLWFTEQRGNSIGRITTSGVISEFPIPTTQALPNWITMGSDGNLWFTEREKIGRITPSGGITEFTVSGSSWSITSGPDGNLWFYECGAVGRITPLGVLTEFPLPGNCAGPGFITAGPDGNLWFTENITHRVSRITPAGVISPFTIPTAHSGPAGITAGPDGNLWFTERDADKIARMSTNGEIVEYTIPTANSYATGIASGPDGNLWFTEGRKIARITPDSRIALTPSAQIISAGDSGSITTTLDRAQDTDTLVSLNSSNSAIAKVPSSVIIPAHQTNATFEVTGVAAGGPVTITATLPANLGGGSATALIAATKRRTYVPLIAR